MTIQKLNSLPSDVPAGAIPASIRDELLQVVVASWHEYSTLRVPPLDLFSDGIVVWESDNELTVDHGEIVGGDFRQTREGRRKRFRAKLKMKMELIGWELVSQLRRLKFRKTK
jgi:hypothetical protein